MTTENTTAVQNYEQAKGLAHQRFGGNLQNLHPEAQEKAIYYIQLGFNPWLIMIYENQPWPTIDGWWDWAGRQGLQIARVPLRPLVTEEDRRANGLLDHQVGFVCEVYLAGDETGHPTARGLGVASALHPHREDLAKGKKGNPIERQRSGQMAMVRAQRSALSQLRVIRRLPQVEVSFYDPDVGVVVEEGSPIIEGEATVLSDEVVKEEQAVAEKEADSTPAPASESQIRELKRLLGAESDTEVMFMLRRRGEPLCNLTVAEATEVIYRLRDEGRGQ